MSVGEYCSYELKIMHILFVYISILHRMHISSPICAAISCNKKSIKL